MATEAMIPVPPRPGDVLPGPEEPGPRIRGGEPLPLAFQALEEIDALKRTVDELGRRLDDLERRLTAVEKTKA